MSHATVNIPLTEFQQLQAAKQEAEMETAKLRQQLASMKTDASDQAMLATARAAVEIVRFAVAHLPAEDTKGWPTGALHRLAEALPQLPDATADDGELATTLSSFARECEEFERRRQVISPQIKVAPAIVAP